MVYQYPELTIVPTAAPTLGKMSRHLLLQACALHKLRVHVSDVSSASLQTSASEEHQELTIKAPPEVGYLFSDSLGKRVIGIHVDHFLIGLADGTLGEKWMSEIKSFYWKISDSEFAGIRVRQHRDFSITVDLEDYTNKFIAESPITRERSRQRQESLTAQELSMLRCILGTASRRAQQVSPQFAADVSLLLSATAHPVVQDLLDANKLVRDMRRSSAVSSCSLFQ